MFDEGFMVLSALCSKPEVNFDPYVSEVGPFIFHSLKTKTSFKQSSNLISNLCWLSESKSIIEGFEDYTPLLFEILHDKQIENEDKWMIIESLTETFRMTLKMFGPFFENMLKEFMEIAS